MVGANGVCPETEPKWRLDLSVRASPESLGAVRESLGRLRLPTELLDDARLLLSELVGNSIRHSGLQANEYVHITAEWSGASLRVAVRDRTRPLAPPAVAAAICPPPGAE